MSLLRAELEAFVQDVFASLPRADQRNKGNLYLHGLMLDGRRKSMQPMGVRLGFVSPDAATGLTMADVGAIDAWLGRIAIGLQDESSSGRFIGYGLAQALDKAAAQNRGGPASRQFARIAVLLNPVHNGHSVVGHLKGVAEVEINLWWLELDLPAKEWLRENLEAEPIPEHVLAAVKSAGGDVVNGTLTRQEWNFIETQSEFVD